MAERRSSDRFCVIDGHFDIVEHSLSLLIGLGLLVRSLHQFDGVEVLDHILETYAFSFLMALILLLSSLNIFIFARVWDENN